MKSQRQRLENRLEVLILHLLKWDHQPDQRSNRWRASVTEQRQRIQRLLRDSPSLRPSLAAVAHELYPDAARQATVETLLEPSVFPKELPYPIEMVFERDLPADELPEQRSTRKERT